MNYRNFVTHTHTHTPNYYTHIFKWIIKTKQNKKQDCCDFDEEKKNNNEKLEREIFMVWTGKWIGWCECMIIYRSNYKLI